MTQHSAHSASLLLSKSDSADLTIETIEVAVPKANEVRIKMIATGVCHTDGEAAQAQVGMETAEGGRLSDETMWVLTL